MAPQVRKKICVVPRRHEQATLSAVIIATEGTGLQLLSQFSNVTSIPPVLLLAFMSLLGGCTNLHYGQIDCAVLQGEAARMCQEYRQRKADADIRVAAVELVQGYNKCVAANKPDAVKNKCSIYSEPLKDLGLKPLEEK